MQIYTPTHRISKQPLLLLFLGLLILPFVVADRVNAIYNTPFNLALPCRLNGANCPNSVVCSLTVWSQDMSVLLANQNMSYNIGYYNYTIPSSNLSTVGLYKGDMTCNNSGYNASYIFDIEVTKKPVLPSDTNFVSESKILGILISLVVIFMILGIYYSMKGGYLRYLFFMLGILSIDALTYFGYTIADSISSKFANVMHRFYYIMLVVTFLIFILMLIELMLTHLKVKKQRAMTAKDYYGDLNK